MKRVRMLLFSVIRYYKLMLSANDMLVVKQNPPPPPPNLFFDNRETNKNSALFRENRPAVQRRVGCTVCVSDRVRQANLRDGLILDR